MAQAVTILIDGLRIYSEANRTDHWRRKDARANDQRRRLMSHLLVHASGLHHAADTPTARPPYIVTLTRIAPRPLDDDNLARAFKRCRDTLCSWLLPHNRSNQHRTWADDSDGQIEWQYRQEKGEAKQYAVRVEIEPA